MRTSLRSAALWTAQAALAALFLFAGVTKFVMSAEALTASGPLPVGFYHFIGICEILGALGLVLPGALRIRRELTPIAAIGLVVIMSGAVGMTVQGMGVGAAIVPGVTGVICGLVGFGRRDWLAARGRPVGAPVRAGALLRPAGA